MSRVPRRAFVVAVVLTAFAALQQCMLAVGLGGWLPGWQPWPYLLLAAPAWWVARPVWATHQGPDSWSRVVRALRRVPPWAYLICVLVLTAGLWVWFQDKEPHLGHEEAVYANKARSWLDGTPDAGWGIYRPVGLPALGRLALAIHPDVGALRAVALLLTLFTLVACYLVVARWTTPRRAVVVVLLLLAGLGFLRRTPEFLNDIGATGLLLIVVALLVRTAESRGRRSNALMLVPLVALGAFYLRYGVAGNLLGIAIAGVLAYGPRLWLSQGWRLLVAAGLFLAGLLPHLLYAASATGSPLGIIFSATEKANRTFVGDGFLYYLLIIPYRLAGDLGGVLLILGLVATFLAVRRLLRHAKGRGTVPEASLPELRRHVFLGSSAVLVVVILGFVTDGEPRFIYLPVILLTVLGVTALAELTGRWSARVLSAVGALAGITVLGTAQVVAFGAMPSPARLAESTVPVARELATDRPCLLVSGYEPELGWYSGCDAVTYAQYREIREPLQPGTRVSFVRFERGRLQPSDAELARLVGDRPTSTRVIPTDGSVGDGIVTTLR